MRLMSLGVRSMSLGVGLDQELGDEFDGDFDEFGRGFADSTFADEFGGDFDEFDEFGGAFVVCLLQLEVRLMRLGVFLMSLGVGLEQELEDEFGVDFEFDEFGGAFAAFGDAFDEFGDAFDEFGRGFGQAFL